MRPQHRQRPIARGEFPRLTGAVARHQEAALQYRNSVLISMAATTAGRARYLPRAFFRFLQGEFGDFCCAMQAERPISHRYGEIAVAPSKRRVVVPG